VILTVIMLYFYWPSAEPLAGAHRSLRFPGTWFDTIGLQLYVRLADNKKVKRHNTSIAPQAATAAAAALYVTDRAGE